VLVYHITILILIINVKRQMALYFHYFHGNSHIKQSHFWFTRFVEPENPRYDSYYGMNKQISYEKNNRIEEYEVFQIINKRDSLFNLIKRTFNFY
jgi:hypothetical protein